MQGKVLGYDAQTGGMISGTDGKRYNFSPEAIAERPFVVRPGTDVDFEADGDRALSIYPLTAVSGEKSKIAAALLAFFLGALGAHKFYLGYKTQGIIMLVVWALGFLLLAIPSAIIGLIALVEAVIYIIKTDEEFERIYVQGKRTWF